MWPDPTSRAKGPGWRAMLDVVPAPAGRAGAPQACDEEEEELDRERTHLRLATLLWVTVVFGASSVFYKPFCKHFVPHATIYIFPHQLGDQ